MMISIPFNPMMFNIGPFAMSWHGFWSFVGILVAVYLVVRWSKRDGINTDIAYDVALWGILGGIVGARLMHVFDNLGYYLEYPSKIIMVWSGGIGFLGGMIGGILVGGLYAKYMNYPVGKIADYAAPAMAIAHIIGRIGDIWNGEHLSIPTSLPWGWVFTHPDSPGRKGAERLFNDPNIAVHPVVVYEMIWNAFIVLFLFKSRDKFNFDGSLWIIYMFLYSIGRFILQFMRMDDVKFTILGLDIQEAHIVTFALFIISTILMILFVRPRNHVQEASIENKTLSGRRKKLNRNSST